MNTSAIFKAAHALTKATIQTSDNYAATFAICLKVIYAESKEETIEAKLLAMGLKVWEKAEMKRIYMTCAQFNQATGFSFNLNDKNNKIFFDCTTNAIMRSYKSKTPSIEVQF
jgi:hypothetical protein